MLLARTVNAVTFFKPFELTNSFTLIVNGDFAVEENLNFGERKDFFLLKIFSLKSNLHGLKIGYIVILLTEFTKLVCVRLFQGKSRKCDQYILQQHGNISPDPHTTTEEYIMKEVKKRLDEDKKQFEYTMLLKENSRLRKSRKKLKKKAQELQANKLNSVKELIQMAAFHFGNG